MIVFDGVIVRTQRVEDQRFRMATEAVEIVKVLSPFLAEDGVAATKEVLFDYGREQNLTGKQLADYEVRLRTFNNA